MERSKFFEAFMKQQKNEKKTVSKKGSFFFAFYADSKGVYVKSVDSSLKVKNLNPERYNGELKDTVELFNRIKRDNRAVVDWGNPYSNIYLNKYPDLLDSIYSVENIVDSNGKAIYSSNGRHSVTLTVEELDNFYSCRVSVGGRATTQPVSSRYILTENRLYLIDDIGRGYKSLNDLNATIKKDELESYLSIVFSNFNNIDVKFKGYKVEEYGEIELTPSLLIESIDESSFITLTTTLSYRDLISPEFYSAYKPGIHVVFNHDSCIIELYKLRQPDYDILDNLIKQLYYLESKYKLEDSFNIEPEGVLLHPNLGNILFSSELKLILDNFSIFGEKFLKKRKIKKSKPNLELLLQSTIDYLQGSAFLKIYGEEQPLYQAIKSFDEKGYIPLQDGSIGVVDSNFINKIRNVIHEGKSGVEVSFFDLPYIEDELEGRIKGDDSLSRLKLYRESGAPENREKLRLDKLNGTLRDYQYDGVNWMLNLHKIGISGCLADDMGLGKTVQTLALLLQVESESNNRPILIVMPKSLIFNWENEIRKFAPSLDYSLYYGKDRDSEIFTGNRIILTTYHTLRNDIEKLKDIKFFYVILDEIQNIKNHFSQIAKSCFILKSEHRLGISGTPVENSLSDLYSISRFLNPSLFGSFHKFKEKWSAPEISDILSCKIKPLFLRRLKESVLDELPDKFEQVLYVDMDEKQKSHYEHVRKDYHNKISLKIREEGIDKSQLTIIKAFMELRQIASIPEHISEGIISSPKKELLVEQVIDTVSLGHKVLVFSNFVGAVEGIGLSLSENGIGNRVITGATDNREQIVDDFMSDDSVKVLVMTLKTGGVGLNLTAADYVYIFDPWWNPASEQQAIDRTHRIGQKNSVFCYRLIARGSIEEKIIELHSRKRTLFENLFNNGATGREKLTVKDIDYLLG